MTYWYLIDKDKLDVLPQTTWYNNFFLILRGGIYDEKG